MSSAYLRLLIFLPLIPAVSHQGSHVMSRTLFQQQRGQVWSHRATLSVFPLINDVLIVSFFCQVLTWGTWKNGLFQIGKGVCQGCILSPCLFNLYADYIMWNARLKEHKLESRLLGEIPITSIRRWHHPYGRKQRRTKEPLHESERGEWKNQLKTQHSEN